MSFDKMPGGWFRTPLELVAGNKDQSAFEAGRRFGSSRPESQTLARSQQAKYWELVYTTNLARLLARQGKRDDARAMLAEICGWFTEGFDTPYFKNAKALLDELSNQAQANGATAAH